jgi:hypothetical protein
MVNSMWVECWMCGLPTAAKGSTPTQIVQEFGPPRESTLARFTGWGVMATLAVLILLVLAGMASSEGVGAALVMGVFFVPAVIATVTRSLRRRSTAQALTTWGHVSTFVVSLAITFASLMGLAVAAGIALFVTCLASMR